MTIFRVSTYYIVFWYFLKRETEEFKKRAIILAVALPYKATACSCIYFHINWQGRTRLRYAPATSLLLLNGLKGEEHPLGHDGAGLPFFNRDGGNIKDR